MFVSVRNMPCGKNYESSYINFENLTLFLTDVFENAEPCRITLEKVMKLAKVSVLGALCGFQYTFLGWCLIN